MKRLVAISLVALAMAGGACGGKAKTVPPPAVPVELAPPTIAPDLTLSPYDKARKAFARAGSESLVADGRLWEIRKGPTLVGTLQISTVKPDEVSLAKTKQRKSILDTVMTGSSYDTIDVHGVQVSSATAGDKSLYVWFGTDLFEVLQVKSSKLNPEDVVTGVVDFQKASGKFHPLGSDAENEEVEE